MLSIAICDDEKSMRDGLSGLLTAYFKDRHREVRISQFEDGKSFERCREQFGLVFLDIRMAGPTGMETARALRKRRFEGLIIFITVLKEYVFEAFEVEAFDYLVKPLEKERFRHTMDRAVKVLDEKEQGRLLIQKGREYRLVAYGEILYCEAIGRKIYLHLKNGEVIDYYAKMEKLEQELGEHFYRCHRSYLIHLRYVNGYEEGAALLEGGGSVPVSRLRGQDFAQRILSYMEEKRR